MKSWRRNRPKRTAKYYRPRAGKWLDIKKPGRKDGKYLMRIIRGNKQY